MFSRRTVSWLGYLDVRLVSNFERVLCKINTDEIYNLVKEKYKTIHYSEYNNPKRHGYTVNGAKENYVDDDIRDVDREQIK